MPNYVKSPNVPLLLFIGQNCCTRNVYGLIHISDFESIKCGVVQSNPILLYRN